MAVLNGRDLELVEGFLRRLYSFRHLHDLREFVLTDLDRLIGSRQTSWNYVAPQLGRAEVMAYPEEPDHMQKQEALQRHVQSHPLLQHYLTTGDPKAVKISDFLSTQQFHNTALYDELYRPLKYEDQYAMQLFPPAAEFITLVVARDKATFTERERRLLNLVRPHIAQAYRNVQTFARLSRRLGRRGADAATCMVELHADRRIARYTRRARRWLAEYFQDLPYAPAKLPQSLDDWVRRGVARSSEPDFVQTMAPLVRRLADRELIVRLLPVGDDGHVTLLLEERTIATAREKLAGFGLTPRELEVLLQLEQGKRNDEIALALGIRPRTVRKHLEHIYDKLDVDNRTAAVARLHASARW